MSQENVEVVMSGYDAVQRGDYESPLQVIDEDILWDMSGFGLPDLAKVYRGHDGLREFWVAWLAAWETIEFKTPEWRTTGTASSSRSSSATSAGEAAPR